MEYLLQELLKFPVECLFTIIIKSMTKQCNEVCEFFCVKIERRKMADTEPNMHNSVISRVLGQRWQKMSYAERQPFVREADKVRQLHLQEHPDYRYCPRRKEKRKLGERRGYVRQPSTVLTTRETFPVRQSSSTFSVISSVPPAHCSSKYCCFVDSFVQNHRFQTVIEVHQNYGPSA
jgi:HMG (high mobility group) box